METDLPKLDSGSLREYEAPSSEFTPEFILLISGKRKSGKDYIASLLESRLKAEGMSVGMLRMANPVKQQWAEMHGASYEKMLNSGTYKEQHRPGMAKLSVEIRTESFGYFPYHAILMDAAVLGKTIWICPDMRHIQDINWFLKNYPGIIKQIRIEANEDVRKSRGFVFTEEIDTGPTECELDGITSWDQVVVNNGTGKEEMNLQLDVILNWITAKIHSKLLRNLPIT